MNALTAYIMSKGYTDDSLKGAGALAGVPCQIQGIAPITGGNRVTFLWVDNLGDEHTDTMDVIDGEDGSNIASITQDGNKITVTLTDGSSEEFTVPTVKGDKGERGEQGEQGQRGEKGTDGTSATIAVGSVTSGTSPSVTNSGTSSAAVFNFVLPKGDKGDRGVKGDDGQDGKSFEIKAQYATYEALIAAHPTGQPGDAYFVGEGTSPDLYTWLSEDEVWYNNGPIAGVKGDKGDTGDDGYSPSATVTKSGKIATITIQDKSGTTTETVSDGADGEDGKDGEDGEDGVDGKSAYEVAVEEGYSGTETEWLASLKGDKGDDGEGVPEGGTAGQFLIKKSGTDYDTEWGDMQASGSQLKIVDLGTAYTTELKNDISSGKFEKAVVGGKLTINNHVYYFAHPDYWLHCGDTECTTHHMLVVPAGNIGTGQMNSTNITTGAYAGSDMKTGNNSNTALATAAAQIKTDFGAANILSHRELFANAVTDGKASGWAWADSDIDLMNEVMVYGCNVWSSSPGYETGIDKCQLKLFQERPDLITIRAHWWLRSVASASTFAHVSSTGNAGSYSASSARGVRPAFAIC